MIACPSPKSGVRSLQVMWSNPWMLGELVANAPLASFFRPGLWPPRARPWASEFPFEFEVSAGYGRTFCASTVVPSGWS